MRVEKFQPIDLALLTPQPQQQEAYDRVTYDFAAELAKGTAYTVWKGGVPVACAGLINAEAGPAAWAWLSEDVDMIWLHRRIRAALRAIPKVYAYADENWPQACRWLTLLGFEPTDVVDYPLGQPHRLYVRIRHG